ncbi:MAG: OmpW family outer membrane protein [Oceanospirillaceae bacterium]
MKHTSFKNGLGALLASTTISLLIAPTVMAQNNTGWYGEISILSADAKDAEFNSTGRNTRTQFNKDAGYSAALGYKFTANAVGQLRVETEFVSTSNDVDGVTFNGNNFSGSAVGGDIDTKSLFINAKYAFDVGSDKFSPYVGAGIGYSKVNSSINYNNGRANINDDDTSLSYQLLVGADININKNWQGFAQYRYSRIDDLNLTRFGGPASATATNQSGDFSFNALSVGLRYQY